MSVYVDEIKLAGKKHHLNPTWKTLMKDVDLGEPTSFLDHERYLNPEFLLEPWKNFQFPRNRMQIFHDGLVTWKVMQRSAWKDIANSMRTKVLLPSRAPVILGP